MSDEFDLTRFPSSPKKQAVSVILQTLSTLVPGASVGSVLVSLLLPEVDKTRIAWLESLGVALYELRHRVGSNESRLDEHDVQLQELERELEEFVQRPEFQAAVLRTTDIALRDPQRKKWEALRNIVLQNTKPNPPDDDLQLMFINNMAVFGEWHIRLLKFVDTPRSWQMKQTKDGGDVSQIGRGIEPFDVITHHIPEAGVEWHFCEQCLADLEAKGLMSLDATKLTFEDANFPPIPIALTEIFGRGPRPQTLRLTTLLGQQFLEFIAGPAAEDSQGTAKE